MEIEEAIETIMNMMIEHPNTNSGRAVRAVFDALLTASMGYDRNCEDGKSGPLGVLDLGNMAALNRVMCNKEARLKICHAIYYGGVN